MGAVETNCCKKPGLLPPGHTSKRIRCLICETARMRMERRLAGRIYNVLSSVMPATVETLEVAW